MDNAQNRKILSLLLFPLFQSSYGLDDFKKFLETAFVGDGTTILVCGHDRSAKPGAIQAWFAQQTRNWSGPIALFYWAEPDSVQAASSKLGTFDWKSEVIRRAHKILMVNELDEPHSPSQYPSMQADGTTKLMPLLLVRTGPTPNITTQRELARFLGSQEKPPRRDETLTAIVTASPRRGSGAIEAVRIGSGRSDPRIDPESDRETLPPPPGHGPIDPFARPAREDPTQPK
jgi:hypothetical protein